MSRHRARVGAGPGNREGTASSASECGAALTSLQTPCLCDCRLEVAGQAGGARTSPRPHTSAGGTWSREGRLSSLAWLPGEPRAESSRNATMTAFLWIQRWHPEQGPCWVDPVLGQGLRTHPQNDPKAFEPPCLPHSPYLPFHSLTLTTHLSQLGPGFSSGDSDQSTPRSWPEGPLPD